MEIQGLSFGVNPVNKKKNIFGDDIAFVEQYDFSTANMKVELLSYTDLSICDIAISKCYGKEPYGELEKQQARINRVANVSKHASTIEHLVYSFDIDG